MAHANIAVFGTGNITGTATFTKVTSPAAGVRITVTLAGCPEGVHGIHIHEGTACTTTTTQGDHWGGTGTAAMPTRGEGIGGTGLGEITCNFAGQATLTYDRTNANPATLWTVGDGSATDIIGKPLIVHGLTGAREGCGVIVAN